MTFHRMESGSRVMTSAPLTPCHAHLPGRCLETWLCEGVIDDPFAESMILENVVRT